MVWMYTQSGSTTLAPHRLRPFTPSSKPFSRRYASVRLIWLAKVSLWAFYQTEEGYILRLVNNTPSAQTAVVTVAGHSFELSFTPYEAKGCLFDGSALTELQQWL